MRCDSHEFTIEMHSIREETHNRVEQQNYF